MSSMESFYGGRQGASFIIVKRFDGIDIPQDDSSSLVYRFGWFAKDQDGYFIVLSDGSLIEKTIDTYTSYADWGSIPKDGITTVISQDGNVSNPLPAELAEGMKQCFEQGGATASEVGYGEYVIIDTIFGFGEYGNPDNGKVYRRGMNYDGDLGGAEYIGQIVGPKGDVPKLDMSTVEEIASHTESRVRHYDMTEGDAQDGIVPGKYETNLGTIEYNDDITYGWATVRDEHGNTTGALIGFTFPYLIPEITSSKRSPYYTQEDYDEGRITDINLIGTIIQESDDFILFVDNGFSTLDRDPTHGDTGHAFYRKWKLAVPQGIKGDSQTSMLVVPQEIRAGSGLWFSIDDVGVTDPDATATNSNSIVFELDDEDFDHDNLYPYNSSSTIVGVKQGGNEYYAMLEDGFKAQVMYVQTLYDNLEEGESLRVSIGDYDVVDGMWLTADGELWVRYRSKPDEVVNDDSLIPWVTNIQIDQNGEFSITYNNEENKDAYPAADGWTWDTVSHTGTKILNFIDHVSIDDDGTIHFWYSNGTEAPNTGYEYTFLKYLINADIDTGLDEESEYDFDGEGTGTQKVELTWNTETFTPGTKDTDIVGAPLNYIMEAIVTTYDSKAPNTPQNHLLVLYSDPAYRQWLIDKYQTSDPKTNKIWRYTSQKFTQIDPVMPYKLVTPIGTENPYLEGWYELDGSDYVLTTDLIVYSGKNYYIKQISFVTRDDWFDLGYVKGEPGGLHIIGEAVLTDLVDGTPPEDMPGNTPEDRGWAYLVVDSSGGTTTRTIYTYDYKQDKWIIVGEIGAATTDPTQIVILDESKIEGGVVVPNNPSYSGLPKTDGLWFIRSTMKAAY